MKIQHRNKLIHTEKSQHIYRFLRYIAASAATLFVLLYPITAQAQTSTPVISEFMAVNESTISDEDGAYSDWIEVHNGTGDTLDLTGWHLTDDATNPTKWTFPATTLNSGRYLIVFASSKDRAIAGAPLHTNFKLSSAGEYLGLYDNLGNMVHEYTPSFPTQTADVAYGLPTGSSIPTYLSSPSPGASNGSSGIPTVQFSKDSGLFIDPFNLTISAPLNSNDVIRYTVDGTEPNASSSVYAAPLSISQTTRVRARVFRNGAAGASHYTALIKMRAALSSFSSNLPLIVVDTFGAGLPGNDSPLEQGFLAVIEPGNGALADRAALLDPANYAGFAGIKIRGNSSASFPKKQYRVELWDDRDEQVKENLLGMGSESDWILYAPGRMDPVMISNPLVYGLAHSIGVASVDTRFVELYFNDQGTLSTNDYSGIYVLMESIKRDKNRVDIEPLSATQNSLPDLTGGYMFDSNWQEDNRIQWNSSRAMPSDLLPDYSRVKYGLVEPNDDEVSEAQLAYIQDYIEDFESALFGSNPEDPLTGFPAYIDIESFINHHIIHLLGKNPDGLRLSTSYYKPRGKKLFAGPLWDFDRSMGSFDSRTLVATEINVDSYNTVKFFEHDWYGPLFQSSEFHIAYMDRWYALRQNELSLEKLNARIDALHAEIIEAYPRESAAWGAPYGPRYGGLQGEIDALKEWLAQRVDYLDSYFAEPPTFNQFGGDAAAGFGVTISGDAPIYYTVDGSDPRLVGGGISPSAMVYSGPIALNQSTQIRVRSRPSGIWSAVAAPTFNIDPKATAANLIISEIHYDPYDGSGTEFIELKNVGNSRIDLTGVRFAQAVTATIGFTMLEPNAHLVIVKDQEAFDARYRDPSSAYYRPDIVVEGQWIGGLNNDGETIALYAADGSPITQVAYSDSGSWPGRADGNGSSLELVDPTALPAAPDDPGIWRSSSEFHGSPGRDGLGPDDRVAINEILAHTDLPQRDTIELFNRSNAAVDISNWYLSDNNGEYKKFRIPAGTILPTQGFGSFDETDFNNASNAANPVPFSLNSSKGDDVYLVQADGAGAIIRFIDHVEFNATANGESIGRWPDGSGEFYPMQAQTLYASNASNNNNIRVGPVVISEIHYNPAGTDTNVEYIEVYNAGTATETLDNWRLRGEVDYNFPNGLTLAPGEALVIVDFDPLNGVMASNFRTTGSAYDNIVMLGPWTDNGQLDVSLSNGGGNVKLQRPDTLEVPDDGSDPFYPMLDEETVKYDDDAPWTTIPDSNGPTLERIDPAVHGNDPTNWQASLRNGGTPGIVAQRGDVSCDRIVNVIDALYIMQHEVDVRTTDNGCPMSNDTTHLFTAAGDVNNDGITNVVDALFIMQCDVQIPNEFCP